MCTFVLVARCFPRKLRQIIGIACLLLAAKRDEAPRRLRDVVQAYHTVAYKTRRTSEREPAEEVHATAPR